ncbi:hypothetical protein [Tenacibaculum sp. nBUS_03]|uniref:hypothetical protein n=1 Tax=Tenacibaculum sp. nBUS_03 TaxID=3395320 RepID=UPI003EBE247C
MKEIITIAAAGNTEPPVCKLIKDKGYLVKKEGGLLIAKKDNLVFKADGALELGGLIFLYENKGNKWRVNDNIIDEYCQLYDE